MRELYTGLPLYFVENPWKSNTGVLYYTGYSGQHVYLSKDRMVFDLMRNKSPRQTDLQSNNEKEPSERLTFTLKFLDTGKAVELTGADKQQAKVNYFIGNDKKKWKTGLSTYGGVTYREIYKGVDLKVYGNAGALEYEFIVQPGTDPRTISLGYEGVQGLKVNDQGELLIATAFGEIRESKPYAYQLIDGKKVEVSAAFRLAEGSDWEKTAPRAGGHGAGKAGRARAAGDAVGKKPIAYGFQVASYDPAHPLIIDPTLYYSTFLGGSGYDAATGIAVDGNKNVYITGSTASWDFLGIRRDSARRAWDLQDAFVVKLTEDGHSLVYAAYLGGTGLTGGAAVAADTDGNAYLTGSTWSSNYPVVNAFQQKSKGGFDAFVTKLSADGSEIEFSSYLGGRGNDAGTGIAVDKTGRARVTGSTNSPDFPRVRAMQAAPGGDYDAFIAGIAPSGGSLVYSTYLGGEQYDAASAIAVDEGGEVYVTGSTGSRRFPVLRPIQTSLNGRRNAFVAKFDPEAAALSYSTFLGGRIADFATGIAVGRDGSAYVAGYTFSTDFPVVSAFQSQARGFGDAFVTKIQPEGIGIDYSTYLGGSGWDWASSITVDEQGSAFVAGQTWSRDFPLKNPLEGGSGLFLTPRVFVTKLPPTGASLSYSTFFGGRFLDYASGIAVDEAGSACVSGATAARDFPAVNAYQQERKGGWDAYAAKLVSNARIAVSPTAADFGYVAVGTSSGPKTFTVSNTGKDDLTLSRTALTGDAAAEFAVRNDNCAEHTLAASQTCTVDVVFSPVSSATKKADLTIASDDAQTPLLQVALSGDSIPLEITVTSPADGLITREARQTITGRLNKQGSLTINGETVVVGPDKGFSHAVLLAEGLNTFELNAVGRSEETAQVSIRLTLDTIAPQIAVISPADGLVTNLAAQTITGNLSEDAALTVNGRPVALGPNWGFSQAVTLVEGLNSFEVTAVDRAGNTGRMTLRLTLDTVPPQITHISPPDSFITGNPLQVLAGRLSETASLTVNGQPASLGPDNSYAFSTVLLEGVNAFELRATDGAGNSGLVAVRLVLDRVPPQVVISSPVEGLLTNQASQILAGRLSEPANLTLNGKPHPVGPGGDFSCEVTLTEGLNTFHFRAEDGAANSSELTLHLTLDTVPPEITVSSPADGLLTNRSAQTAAGHLSEPGLLTLNGEAVPVGENGVFSQSDTLDEGLNTLQFSALDEAGNSGSLTIQITLDTVSPSSPNAALITVGPSTGGRVTVAGTAGSVETGALVTVTNPGTQQTRTVDSNADGSFTLEIGALAGDSLSAHATDRAGNASGATSLRVPAPPQPPAAEKIPEGSFGDTYRDLVPADAAIFEYAPKRFSLITGLVADMDGAPVPGVAIAIHGHSEYGTASTNAEGRFTIPVEGGGILTVVYRKTGLITAHRQVYVPWNDIAVAEAIRMIAQDPASTVVAFDGSPATVVTHRSTPVSDSFGTRSASMVFTGDNRAYSVDANGNVIGELTTITTRATEFTTLESMPAKLPPNSAYTYCTELQVDGVERVKFDKPVIVWVENFLGFPVGEAVPVGWYDRDRGVWVPSDNGRVVRLLDTDSDGIVDALDANGDGQPDDLNSNGILEDEVAGLDDSSRYTAGSSFWRVAVTHFTPWDCNWPFGPPLDAIPPNPVATTSIDQQLTEQKSCPLPINSHVEERSRTFHEDIPIPGTEMNLHYASNRVDGYKHLITVPVSGESVPSSLKRIIVEVEVAGKTFEVNLEPLPNQMAQFEWDGRDLLGRPVSGAAVAHVSIGFVYDIVYLTPADFGRAFAQAGTDLSTIRGRQEIISWSRSDITIHCAPRITARQAGAVADGWTLSLHHYLSPSDLSTLYKGDGTIVGASPYIITTVAGGQWGFSGDGGPATQAALSHPTGVTVDASGNIYFTDLGNVRIRKVDASGIITTVAGNGQWGFSGDGGPATQATMNWPNGVEVDHSGNIYIADGLNNRIRKVDASGIITTVAGNGQSGSSGDGGPATQAAMRTPAGIAVDASGNIHFADLWNNRVRKIDASGIITTVAGNGQSGSSGDGGPATQAAMYLPMGVAVDPSGNIYIAEHWGHRIRRVDASGIISTVAGNGQYGFSGDGGPATRAALKSPRLVAVDDSGNIYIADTDNRRIRKVDASGIISTVAGNGQIGFSGDGGPPTQAAFNSPMGVAVDASGNVYITDYANHRIQKVSPSPGFTTSSDGDIPVAEDNGLGHIVSSTGYHKKTTDLHTGQVLYTFGYDQDNLLTSITDRFGGQTTIHRDGNGVATSITSPDGITTTLSIDPDSRLTGIAYPDGSDYHFEYTAVGLLTAKIDPKGNRFEHLFDSLGRLQSATDQEGGSWSYTRTAYPNGDILTESLTAEGNRTTYLDHTKSTGAYTSKITDPTGAETLFSQSADGLSVNKSLSCGMALAFQYGVDSEYRFPVIKQMTETTPANLKRTTLRAKSYQDTDANKVPDRITETVTVNGKATSLLTDTLQAKKVVTTPQGRTLTAAYDPANLLTRSVGIPGLYDFNFEYDARGRLTSVAANTREISFTYDAQGNLSSMTGPLNQTTAYSHDAVGRITGVQRPDGNSLGFSYDRNGNMTVLTNPSGIDHTFGYNRVNLNGSYTTPLSGSYAYTYDRDRRLKEILFPSGKTIHNVYDKTRLTQIRTPEGNIDMTYLCSTKVGTVTRGTEQITYGYDGSLITSVTLGGTMNQSLAYAYNNDFRPSRFTYAGGSVDYTYDNDGLLTRAGSFAVTRNAQNGLPETVTGGALNLSRAFNGYGEQDAEQATVGGVSLPSWQVTRDDTGRIVTKTELLSGTATAEYSYAYDSLGRLATVTKDGTTVEEYQYAPDGTRTSEKNLLRGIASRTMTYSDEDHLLTAGSTTYEYDLDGFLTTRTNGANITRYQYSARGELLGVTFPSGTIIEYLHDPVGRRIAKKVNGTITEKYLWQGMTRLLAVYDGSNNLLMRFQYADARMPLAMTSGGSTYYLTYDQVGSLRLITDAAGNIVKRLTYDSFGNILADSNPSFKIPFAFAGGLHDPDTKLVRFGFRDYDPDVGRWTAKDPIGFAGGDVNLYGYVLNDPVNRIDPLGLWTFAMRLNFTLIFYDITFSAVLDEQLNIAIQSTVAFGFSISLGASIGGTWTNAPTTACLEGVGTSIGAALSIPPLPVPGFGIEVNRVWSGWPNQYASSYTGWDAGAGISIGSPVTPQAFVGVTNTHWRWK
jgi:RHS repeat-associated protein